MNKKEILYRIHQEDIMRTAHNHLVDSLVGCLQNEYTGRFTEPKNLNLAMKPPPIFRAVVDMLIAQMLHHFSETILDKIVDIIVRCQVEKEHSPECEMVKHGYSDCTCGLDNNL